MIMFPLIQMLTILLFIVIRVILESSALLMIVVVMDVMAVGGYLEFSGW